ncbi:MAG TPA: CopG family transcriptional regulator [Methanosarcinales archaeon]|nr:CopG family transcriptional regulator [Methanosarcinales archaeon]
MKENEFTEVSIPTPLFKQIEKRIESTDFESVSDYITYVIEEILSDTEEEEKEDAFSEEDEEKVKDRLRALGYLD